MSLSAEPGALLGVGAVVTLFLGTLGPIKILGPFAHQTHDADAKVVRQVAIRAFLLSLVGPLG